MKAHLTGIVLAHNEEKNIKSCLSSLSFCNEILVIDDFSFDKTATLARKEKAKVYKHKLNSDFSSQRNWALRKASNMWVLFLDADERVSKSLSKEIQTILNYPQNYDGFYLRRIDTLWGKQLKYGEVGPFGAFGRGKLLRLARKDKGIWKRHVHEEWDIKGNVGSLEYPILHYPHQTLSEFIDDISKRIKIHASELLKEGKDVNIVKIICWPFGKLIFNQILKFGFMDGPHGFVVAMMMSFHSFLSWSELWLQKHSNK